MGTYRPPGATYYIYDFEFLGHRYKRSTKQRTKRLADKVEEDVRRDLEAQAAGVAIPKVTDSPLISEWADVYFADATKQLTPAMTKPRHRAGATRRPRPQKSTASELELLLRVVLRFWGSRPSDPAALPEPGEAAPFHNLRLIDPVRDPEWLLKFEHWLQARGRAGSTNNKYRGVMSQMFKLAMTPIYMKRTGVLYNPFLGLRRDRGARNTYVPTLIQLRAIMQYSSYHVALAISIGALAPKLRLASVLGLRFDEHLDEELTCITVHQHKSAQKTQRPQKAAVSEQLREILLDAREYAREIRSAYVITYQHQPIGQIHGALKNACTAAGVPYGRLKGVTYHTLRHLAATTLAKLRITREDRQSAMGHANFTTTAWYEHLDETVDQPAMEALSHALPLLSEVRHRHGLRASGEEPTSALTSRQARGRFGGSFPTAAPKKPRNTQETEPASGVRK